MRYIIVSILLVVSVAVRGQQPHTRFVVDGFVKQGSNIAFTFDAKGGDLEFSDAVKASIFVFNNRDWRIDTAVLKKSGKGWVGQYVVPSNARFIAFKFYQGSQVNQEATDNNGDQGFYTVVRGRSGEVLPGSALGEAQLFFPQAAASIVFNYFGTDQIAQLKRADALLESERKVKGTDFLNYLRFYLNIKSRSLGSEKAKVLGEAIVNQYLANSKLNAIDLARLANVAAYSIKSSMLVSKINDRILKQFPASNEARFVDFNKIKKEDKDVNVRVASYENFLRKYPVEEWRKQPNGQAFIYYEVYRVLGSTYFDTKQYDKFISLFKQMDFRSGNEVWRWSLTQAQLLDILKVTTPLDTLLHLTESTIPYLIKLKNDGSYREDFDTPELAQANANKQLDERLRTLVFIQNRTKHYDRAMKSFLQISEEGRYADADINEVYMNALEKSGQSVHMLSLLEAAARQNTLTPKMIVMLKEIYLANNQNDASGYDKYFASLRSPEQDKELVDHVKGNMVNFPYAAFELEDANGNKVNSADWKGKIVVIDFWATWCRPCIMAFPGMQLVVDKYANDPNVLVYFIGTMQTGDYKAKSVNYVRSNGFRFNLLHDAPNTQNGQQDAVFKSMVPFFQSSAIPRKIIVKDGVIRYTSEGYSGSPSKLLDEISLAVEMIRNEK